jgi:hypothetical protein
MVRFLAIALLATLGTMAGCQSGPGKPPQTSTSERSEIKLAAYEPAKPAACRN